MEKSNWEEIIIFGGDVDNLFNDSFGNLFLESNKKIYIYDRYQSLWKKLLSNITLISEKLGYYNIEGKYYALVNYENNTYLVNSNLEIEKINLNLPIGFLYSSVSSDIYITSNNFIFITISGNHLASGIYMSKDDGNSWKKITEGNFSNVFITSNNLILASRFNNFLYSKDYGETWIESNSIKSEVSKIVELDNNNLMDEILIDRSIRSNEVIALSTSYPSVQENFGNIFCIITKKDKVYLSTENGVYFLELTKLNGNWKKLFIVNNSNEKIKKICFMNEKLLGCSNNGVFEITNSGLIEFNSGLKNIFIKSFLKKGDNLFIGTKCGYIYEINLFDGKYKKIYNFLDEIKQIVKYKGNLIVNTENNVYISNASNKSWKQIDAGDYNHVLKSDIETSIICVSIDEGIYIQKNFEKDCLEVEGYTITFNDDIFSIVTSNDIFFSIEIYGNDVLKSIDQGKTWESIYICKSTLTSMKVSHNDEIFITTSEGILISNDYGNSWLESNTGNMSFVWNRSLLLKNNYILLSNLTGIYYSLDRGKTWKVLFKHELDVIEMIEYEGKLILILENTILKSKLLIDHLIDNKNYMQ